MLIAVGYLAGTGFAQGTDAGAGGGDAAAEPIKGDSLLTIVLHNVDFVFVVIMGLSVVALTLIISSALRVRKSAFMPEETTNTIRTMIEQRQFKELIDYTESAPSFAAMKEAMETSIGEQSAEQFRKIEYLNIIGNLGPLLGLMGTVLGMIEAFSAMQAAGGNAKPDVLAGGISRALAHTFLGLFLAVPALAAFGVLRTIVDRLTIRAALVCEELLLMIKPAEAKPATARPAGAAAPIAPARPRVNPVPQPPAAPAV
jgi:biopolymer transport protein ExbB